MKFKFDFKIRSRNSYLRVPPKAKQRQTQG
jgi:hypothetical protein